MGECWGGGDGHAATATIMLMGDTCTRGEKGDVAMVDGGEKEGVGEEAGGAGSPKNPCLPCSSPLFFFF
jgi:hypothetical protein